MIKFFGPAQDDAGNKLTGYSVRVLDAAGAQVNIFEDASGTNFQPTADLAPVNDDGMVLFWWVPAAGQTYQLLNPEGLIETQIEDFTSSFDLDGLFGELNGALVSSTTAQTGSVKRDLQAKVSDQVSVKDFGATGDGTTDDRAAILLALASGAGRVYFPEGNYLISDSVEVNGAINLDFAANAKIRVDTGVLEGLQFGKTTLYTGSVTGDPFIEKVTYEGATGTLEDIGVAYYDCVSATFYDFEANNFYFPHRLRPQVNQRVGYCLWVHIRGSRGFHNLSADPASTGSPGVTGYINENTFMMGRLFGIDGRTERQVSFTVGNHNRFYGVCVESPGSNCDYGFYLGGHSNLIDSPRNEGTYAVAGIYLAADSISCEVRAWNLYTGVVDDGTGNITGTRFNGYKATNTAVTGTAWEWGRTSGGGGAPAFRFDAAATSGDDYGFEGRMGRFTEGSFHFKYVRDSDDLIAFSGNATGNFYAARKLLTGNSSWNIGGMKLGNYNFWVDTTGGLRVKNGTPADATDGSVFGNKVGVPASATATGKPGDWAADASFSYFYTGDGSAHSWVRSTAATW